jgi:hypothetical protein
MQLVGPTVKLYDPVGKKTFGNTHDTQHTRHNEINCDRLVTHALACPTDEAEVRKKFQVEPRQVRDVLALMGDDGDNGTYTHFVGQCARARATQARLSLSLSLSRSLLRLSARRSWNWAQDRRCADQRVQLGRGAACQHGQDHQQEEATAVR